MTQSLSSKRLIVCSIVRDAEAGLRNNIPVINKLCHHFADYKIVVFENDSKDETKTLLQEWMDSDPQRIHCIMTNESKAHPIPKSYSKSKASPFFCYERIEKMANLRNRYLNYIKEQNWNADYLIVVDLDVVSISLEGILDSFNRKENWDAIFAYGYSIGPQLKKRYHDTYALWEIGSQDKPQNENSIKENSYKFAKLCENGKDLIPVFSAFGGLAIYKFNAIWDSISQGGYLPVLKNDDDRVEVKCEHFSLLNHLRENGHSNFFINPKMQLKYQKLTFKLLKKFLKLSFANLKTRTFKP